MSSSAVQTYLTPEEYLAWERKAEFKTEAYDRGEKFKHYQQLTSLREYILVSQDEVRVEHYRRQETQWKLTGFRSLENVLSLASVECELSLRDIYRQVEFREN